MGACRTFGIPLPSCGKGALIDRQSLSIPALRLVRPAGQPFAPLMAKTAKRRRSFLLALLYGISAKVFHAKGGVYLWLFTIAPSRL